jgi:hypothetical protein
MPRQKIRPTADALEKLEMIKPKPLHTGEPVADAFYNTFWITPAEAAAVLGMSVKTLQRLKLKPRLEFGGRVRYSRDALYRYIMQHHVIAEDVA